MSVIVFLYRKLLYFTMVQKLLTFLLISMAVTNATAQKRNIYYLKNSGEEVKLKDSADFIRIIQEPDSTNIHYKIFEFFPDNTPKLTGHVSSYGNTLTYEGLVMTFNKYGKKSTRVSYINGIPNGLAYSFFPDGKVKDVLEYFTAEQQKTNVDSLEANYKVVNLFDSTGAQLVREGNGHAITFDTESNLKEEGHYVDGLKDGSWYGLYKESGRNYQEIYHKGKLKSGVQTVDGKQYSYNRRKEDAAYPGGKIAFYSFLQKNFMYPREARERGITGTIQTSFIINTNGDITDIKSYPSLHYSINKELSRVLGKAERWTPAIVRGLPVEQSFQIPVTLKVNGIPSISPPNGLTIETRSVVRARVY